MDVWEMNTADTGYICGHTARFFRKAMYQREATHQKRRFRSSVISFSWINCFILLLSLLTTFCIPRTQELFNLHKHKTQRHFKTKLKKKKKVKAIK